MGSSQHLKTHSKPYKCESCSKGFALRLDLARHIQARHRVGNQKFPCRFEGCIFKATRKDNLRKHMSQNHAPSIRGPVNPSERLGDQGELPHKNAHVNTAAGMVNGINIWEVAGAGGIASVLQLIKQGVDISARAADGSTPLHCAARTGHSELVRQLLEHGANISSQNDKGRTALHEAAVDDRLDAMKMLLDWGADALILDTDGRSVCHLLMRSGGVQSWSLLQEYLGSTIVNREKLNHLNLASRYGNIPIIRHLLNGDFSSVSGLEWTPLHHAAARGYHLAVEILLESRKFDVNSKSRAMTPLHLAVRHGHIQVVQLLLRDQAININAEGVTTRTPAQLAALLGRLDILKLFLDDSRFDLSKTNIYGESILHSAVSGKSLESTEILLRQPNINVNHRDIWSRTPVVEAIKRGHLEQVKLLLEHKDIDIEARTDRSRWNYRERNKTPLQIARLRGNKEMIDLLLAHGAIDYPADMEEVLPSTAKDLERSKGLDPGLDLEMDTNMDLEGDMGLDIDMDPEDAMVMDFEMEEKWQKVVGGIGCNSREG